MQRWASSRAHTLQRTGPLSIFIPISVSEIVRKLRAHPQLFRIEEELKLAIAGEQRDRLAFWQEADEDTHAEWIAGKAVLHPPMRGCHFMVSANLTFEFQGYIRQGFGGILAYETTLVACGRHYFMPDIAYWCEERRSEIGKDASIFPATDFVVEILSSSTEKIDRGIKMQAYAGAGVQEYWLADPRNLTIEVCYPAPKGYFELAKTYQGGRIPCRVLAGLEVDATRLFSGLD